MNPPDPSFKATITRLRAGDQEAAAEVFSRYVHRLIALASHQFDAKFRSKIDPESVVLSAYRSFFLRDDRSPFDLSDWEGLWSLLAKITVRKCIDRRQFWKADRRDVSRELASRSAPSEGSEDEWREAIARGPTPEEALVFAETFEQSLRWLDPRHREIAVLYFNDYPAAEIAERCGCSERMVGRVIARIREKFSEIEAEDWGDLADATDAVDLGPAGEEGLPRRTIRELAVEFLKHPDEWLDHPHPQFGGRTPNEVIAAGHEDKVRNLFFCYEHGLF